MRLCGIAAPSKEARNIVMNALKSNGNMSTRDLFHRVHAMKSPNPSQRQDSTSTKKSAEDDLPIPSISYLKHSVMPFLSSRGQVQKVVVTNRLTEEQIAQRLKQLRKSRRAVNAGEQSDMVQSWKWKLVQP
ncbi:hypothetical protein SCHPADRAFT_903359 [Schizopora paradoxa]|uniref:Uncharacterized protein n=1 Tax=Schizopora paradoxa TaxID=27342 RepID=A0A0H2RRF7_9AGAM|nr:hypothetical protein SCHPADRAFT_903359 [Schizopora paradoxa]